MSIISDSLKALEFDKIKEILATFAKCEQSKAICLSLLPHENIEQVIEAQEYTRDAKKILDMPNDIPIEYVADIKQLEESSLISYLTEEELVDIAKTFRTSRLVRNFMNENSELSSPLNKLARNLTSERELE